MLGCSLLDILYHGTWILLLNRGCSFDVTQSEKGSAVGLHHYKTCDYRVKVNEQLFTWH